MKQIDIKEDVVHLLKADVVDEVIAILKKHKLSDPNIKNLYITALYLNAFSEDKKKLIKEKLLSYKKTTGVLRGAVTGNKCKYCAIGAISNILYSKELEKPTFAAGPDDNNIDYYYNSHKAYSYFIENLENNIALLLYGPNVSDYAALNSIFILNDTTYIYFDDLANLIKIPS